MNDSMLRERSNHTALLTVWAVLIGCVVVGSLAPAASSLMVAVGRLHVWDKLLHFGAYLALLFNRHFSIGHIEVGQAGIVTSRDSQTFIAMPS